ncbi:unnamed protein product [Rhodiola kirilowii]
MSTQPRPLYYFRNHHLDMFHNLSLMSGTVEPYF